MTSLDKTLYVSALTSSPLRDLKTINTSTSLSSLASPLARLPKRIMPLNSSPKTLLSSLHARESCRRIASVSTELSCILYLLLLYN